MTCYVLVFIYQLVGIIFVSHSIILMEVYATYSMIVAGSHLDILASRLAKLGHDTTLQSNTLEGTFRVDCLQMYTKVSRLDVNSSLHPRI